MLQRMTNPKQNKDFVCLTWARWPRVTVCRVGSASRWFKFLLEEEAITNGKQSNVMCCWLIIHQVTCFVTFQISSEMVCESVRTPLSCLRWVSKECNRSMRLDTPCSRVSRVWCWGSWPEKLSLKLRSASLTNCSSSPCDKQQQLWCNFW